MSNQEHSPKNHDALTQDAVYTTPVEGIWSGIPMPWTDDEQLDKDALRRLVRFCAAHRSDGIYVAGTSGEFHAMDIRQFTDVVETFMLEMRRHKGLGHQVGCGAFSLKQVFERASIAKANGAEIIQLNLPGWLPLTDDEVIDFYTAVADRFPELSIVVYDNKASGRVVGADLWPRLVETVPAIVGAKITYEAPELPGVIRSVTPDFRFFAVESTFRAMAEHGVSGVTAWISYSFPQIIGTMWDAVKAEDWDTFAREEEKVQALHSIKAEIRAKGYRAGIVDRTMGLASGCLEPVFARVLKPWRSVDMADVEWVREQVAERLGEDYLFTGDR